MFAVVVLALTVSAASASGAPSCIAGNWQCQKKASACDADSTCKVMKDCIWACGDKDGKCWNQCHSKYVLCKGCNTTQPMMDLMMCVMDNMDISGNYTCHPHSPIPSEQQAASMVRQLVENQTYCNVGTVMKEGGPMAGFPYSTIDHFASDCTSPGDLLLFLSPMHVNTPNFQANNKVSISLRDWNDDKAVDPLLVHRMVLLGNLTALSKYGEPDYQQYADCFFAKHPDAKQWEHLPGHDFRFHRFTHMTTHYTGGFGDTHFIGWLDDATYRTAPSSNKCSAWAGCPASEEACCPFDKDNNFRECCMSSKQIAV